jgi:hypothetical protein
LFVARICNEDNRSGREIRQQDVRQVGHDRVERRDAWQERAQRHDDDTQACD